MSEFLNPFNQYKIPRVASDFIFSFLDVADYSSMMLVNKLKKKIMIFFFSKLIFQN